jgi:hypothetical protein
LHRINPSYARKTAYKSQGFIKNGEINAYFSGVLPIKANACSKKWAFDRSADVSAVRAKVSIGLFAQGQILIGTIIYVGKIPIAAFTFWLFQIAKDKLLTFAWFKFCYEWLIAQLHKIKTSAIYLNIKAKISSVKMWIKSLWANETVRRVKALLGFKQS